MKESQDTRRSVVGGKQYNEELIARFRSRIDEGMSRRFSTTTPAKAAKRIGAVAAQLEAKPEPTTVQTKIKPKRKRLEFEVR